MIVDMAAINKQSGSQGAALQRVLATQLRVEPSSMFLMVNMHELDDSGAAVMLNLMGMIFPIQLHDVQYILESFPWGVNGFAGCVCTKADGNDCVWPI